MAKPWDAESVAALRPDWVGHDYPDPVWQAALYLNSLGRAPAGEMQNTTRCTEPPRKWVDGQPRPKLDDSRGRWAVLADRVPGAGWVEARARQARIVIGVRQEGVVNRPLRWLEYRDRGDGGREGEIIPVLRYELVARVQIPHWLGSSREARELEDTY